MNLKFINELKIYKESVDWLIMNKVGDEISHCLPLPLGSHVAHAVHRREEEVVLVLDDVTRELTIRRVGTPVVLDVPALVLNPFTGS